MDLISLSWENWKNWDSLLQNMKLLGEEHKKHSDKVNLGGLGLTSRYSPSVSKHLSVDLLRHGVEKWYNGRSQGV